MRPNDEEKQRLTATDQDVERPPTQTSRIQRKTKVCAKYMQTAGSHWAYFIFLHICILFFCVNFVFKGQKPCGLATSYRPWPANAVLDADVGLDRYDSQYSGPPNSEQEKAWENLIRPAYISLSDSEMVGSPNPPTDAVKISPKQGGGYLASLEAFHHLHCIRQLRMFVYLDHYFENLTQANIEYLHHHADHCLDALRKSVMCNSDTSLRTFAWSEGENPHVLGRSSPIRECVDWGKLHDYMEDRAVPYGPLLILPDGSEKRLG